MTDGYSLLVVDDSASMRRSIRRIIDMCGFPVTRVHEAENGAAALGVLRERWIDVLLTDVNMPVMNGMQLLREMRSDPGLASVPAIVVSSDGSESRRGAAAGLGVIGYLCKPFQPEAVRDALDRAVGRAA